MLRKAHSERSSLRVTKCYKAPLSSMCPSTKWSRKLFYLIRDEVGRGHMHAAEQDYS